jgi:hypothetical protein
MERMRIGPERYAVQELFEVAAVAAAGELKMSAAADIVKTGTTMRAKLCLKVPHKTALMFPISRAC